MWRHESVDNNSSKYALKTYNFNNTFCVSGKLIFFLNFVLFILKIVYNISCSLLGNSVLFFSIISLNFFRFPTGQYSLYLYSTVSDKSRKYKVIYMYTVSDGIILSSIVLLKKSNLFTQSPIVSLRGKNSKKWSTVEFWPVMGTFFVKDFLYLRHRRLWGGSFCALAS